MRRDLCKTPVSRAPSVRGGLQASPFIGSRNPSWHIMPQFAKLMPPSVYASRVASTPSPFPSPLTTSPAPPSVWEASISSSFTSSSFTTPMVWKCERLQSPQALPLRLSHHRPPSPLNPRFIRYMKNKNNISPLDGRIRPKHFRQEGKGLTLYWGEYLLWVSVLYLRLKAKTGGSNGLTHTRWSEGRGYLRRGKKIGPETRGLRVWGVSVRAWSYIFFLVSLFSFFITT